MMKPRVSLFVKITIALVVIGGYILCASKVRQYRAVIPSSQAAYALMVSPDLLEIVAGEFKGLLADYLLLKASVFFGGSYKTTESDWQALHMLFEQSLNLDPYFFQTCYFIQGFLPWKHNKADDTIALLEKSKKYRYWDWQPGCFIGFDYFYFLKDNLSASKYLMEANKERNAPPFWGMLGVRLSQKAGHTKAALAFLQAMYENSNKEETKKQIEKRITAFRGVLILEKAIEKYTAEFNNPPENLEELVQTGIIAKLPENPYKKYFDYQDGVVGF